MSNSITSYTNTQTWMAAPQIYHSMYQLHQLKNRSQEEPLTLITSWAERGQDCLKQIGILNRSDRLHHPSQTERKDHSNKICHHFSLERRTTLLQSDKCPLRTPFQTSQQITFLNICKAAKSISPPWAIPKTRSG